MAPLPQPAALTLLSDREILILTVQSVHELSTKVDALDKEIRVRAPNPKEKRLMWTGAASGAVALLAFVGDLLAGYKHPG